MEKNTIRLVERYQWPLAFALWCLFVSLCYEFPVRPKPREIVLKPETGDQRPESGAPTSDSGGRTAEAGKLATAAMIILLVSGLRFPVSAFAAATLAHPPAAANPPAAEAPKPDDAAALAKIVGRLSKSEKRSARDWSELGHETLTWGSRLQSQQQQVPEGPVRDALSAADLGAKLDPSVTDWPKLRAELEALLKKPDENKNDDQKKPQDQSDDQDQDQKQQDQKNQKQKSDAQKKQDQQKDKDNAEKNPQSSEQPEKKDEQKPQPGESAFGDMSKKDEPPPPPPPQDTQKVGGEKQEQPKEPIDPSLALPLQKLDQLRNQDSPAQLFQLMEVDKKPTKKSGKDW